MLQININRTAQPVWQPINCRINDRIALSGHQQATPLDVELAKANQQELYAHVGFE
jgi:hypothetical protein